MSDDCDGGGVQQLRDVLADEGRSDDDLVVFVDDEFRASFVAVGVEFRAGDPAEFVLDDPDVRGRVRALPTSVRPARATSGSVKITWGTAAWSAVAT